MSKMKFWNMIMLLVIALSMIVSCKNDDDGDRTCIKNKTSYNWHNAGVQFMNVDGKVVKYVVIGAVEKGDYRYVPIAAEYFVVDFLDDNGVKHESEVYYSNPYVDISFLVK